MLTCGSLRVRQVLQMKADPLIYERLASSVAPGVYGHENVKRAILLMLFGGVHKQTAEVHVTEVSSGLPPMPAVHDRSTVVSSCCATG